MYKHILLLFSVFMVFAFCSKAFAKMPVYTDEIPQEYIDQVKARKEINKKIEKYEKIYDKDSAVAVVLYNPQKVPVVFELKSKDRQAFTEVISPRINDILDFVVANDVVKDGSVIIKKGTPAKGVVRDVFVNFGGSFGSPSEMKVSGFTTTDVNNNRVNLYGDATFNCTCIWSVFNTNLKKNTRFTVYYK